jgi:peptidoglycan/xylan/chitin deacetylase (PgdA/CDA1 family)
MATRLFTMRKIIKKLFYKILCPALLVIGIDRFLRQVSKNRNLIIMYHGVSKAKHFNINGRHLPAGQFERQLLYFKRNFNIVSLKTICEMKLKDLHVRKHTIALTFDDGFLNNVQTAIPLLEKYHIPATFFICGISLLDKNYIHPSDLIDLIRVSSNAEVEINGSRFVKSGNQLIHNENGLDAYSHLNTLSFSEWNEFFASLKTVFNTLNTRSTIDKEVYELISAQTCRPLDSAPLIGIGSHSYHHINLTNLSHNEIIDQFTSSKKALELYSAKPIDAVAFPYGNYNEDVISASKEAGFKYLIAGGDVLNKYRDLVFPRMGVLSAATYSFNILSLNRGFKKFGF